jgi:YD repeat-containing protein
VYPSYDKVGNRKSLIEDGDRVTCTICNDANELVTECRDGQEIEYEYDGRGNQVRHTVVGGHTTYFSYNSRDLITRINSTQAGFTPNEFEYNALGQRTRITDSTGATYFVWDGIRITHEHDGAGNVTKRCTYGHSPIEGASDLIDLQDLAAGGDPHYFYHFDQVGSIQG